MSEVPLYGLRRRHLLSSEVEHSLQGLDPGFEYRGTSLIRNSLPLGPYRRPVPRVLGGAWGGGRFLVSEAPLCTGMGAACTWHAGVTCE